MTELPRFHGPPFRFVELRLLLAYRAIGVFSFSFRFFLESRCTAQRKSEEVVVVADDEARALEGVLEGLGACLVHPNQQHVRVFLRPLPTWMAVE